jgi:hypothetical protein
VLFWADLSPNADAVRAQREAVRRYAAEGWPILGLAWLPEVARGTLAPEAVPDRLSATDFGPAVEWSYCPHGDGPPVCWCRKPLPGLGVAAIQKRRLDPARSVCLVADPGDRAFARALGFRIEALRD